MTVLQELFKDYCSAIEAEALPAYALTLENLAGERQHKAWRSSDPCPLYSATKTITSLAVGFAQAEGLLQLDDRVLQYFPEYEDEAEAGNEQISIRQLLTMSSGHRCFLYGKGDRRMHEEDWARLFFQLPLRDEPGKRFFYSNSDVYLGGRIVEKLSGQSLREYLMPRLFLPLNIINPLWGTCPRGYNNGASKLFLEPKEFARLGHLLLHEGQYEGNNLLPMQYFEAARSKQIESASITSFRSMAEEEQTQMRQGYGYWIWLGQAGSFRADGKYGQFLAVYPEAGVVLSLMAHEERKPYRFILLFEKLLERLGLAKSSENQV